MKKIISLLLIFSMLIVIMPTAYAAGFSDLKSDHWAYDSVNALVKEGTVNGYGDGTFRPNGTVTRAEFSKMIGVGPEVVDALYDDVSTSHWGYKYIMSSGLKPIKDNLFMPDTPITRGDVAELLWKRAGSPKGITTPPAIHRQSENFDAISWIYTNSIMVGDDYINLRLGDSLTRAEASALIVRSRNVSSSTKKTNFYSSLDSGIFKEVYEAFKLSDKPYSADATLTNGEVAYAVARLMSGEDIATYVNVSADRTFDHKYSQPINMLCRYYLGMDKDNAKYADKTATVKEAIAALMFATSKSAKVYIPAGTDRVYPKYKLSGNDAFDKLIKNAYHNGIWLTSPEDVDPDKKLTMKDFAAYVLEFDGFAGFHRVDVITSKKTITKNAKIKVNYAAYPKNESDYRIVIDQLSNKIYEKSYKKTVSLPKASFEIANSYKTMLTSMLSTWVRLLSGVGYELEVTYYPALVVNNGNGYTIRTKVDFVNIPAKTKLGDIIICTDEANGAKIVNSGDSIIVDIDTGKKPKDLIMDINDMVLSQVVR